MAFDQIDPVVNFGLVGVVGTYNTAATSVTLNTGDTATLPDPVADGNFNLVWWDATNYNSPSLDPNVEIIRVTGVSGDILTITRGQENITSSSKVASGASYNMLLGVTKKTVLDIEDLVPFNAKGDILGYTGTDSKVLAVGANGSKLTPDSSQPTGLKWEAPPTKEIFYQVFHSQNYGDYRVRTVGSGGLDRISFQFPSDFSSSVSVQAICIPGGTNASADIDLYSNYAAVGEDYQTNIESDLTITFSLTMNQMAALDISSVFSSPQANDFAGIRLDHNGVGSSTYYLGILLEYNTL